MSEVGAPHGAQLVAPDRSDVGAPDSSELGASYRAPDMSTFTTPPDPIGLKVGSICSVVSIDYILLCIYLLEIVVWHASLWPLYFSKSCSLYLVQIVVLYEVQILFFCIFIVLYLRLHPPKPRADPVLL